MTSLNLVLTVAVVALAAAATAVPAHQQRTQRLAIAAFQSYSRSAHSDA